MEAFFTLLPFIAIFLISKNIYEKYKEDKDKKPTKKIVSRLDKYWLYRYIKLIFIERVNLRQSTLIWRVFFGLFIIIGFITLYVYYLKAIESPPLHLEEMKTEIGIVKSVNLNKKVSDVLILQTIDGKNKSFSIHVTRKEKEIILHKKVKIYYEDGWSSGFSKDNMIYEITINGVSARKNPYSHTRRAEVNQLILSVSKIFFYIALFSLFIMWILNRKELPIHRLNRMKLYKKNKDGKCTK